MSAVRVSQGRAFRPAPARRCTTGYIYRGMSLPLPILASLPALRDALRTHPNVVLEAPPGAGKTTRVPLALLEERWCQGRIVMLEPRRIAARAAARFMASQLAEDVGQTVGYRVRLDTRVSARTRIEVVTEGVLARMLQGDPTLDGVSAVIFDEFHERNLHADLGLTLTLETQAVVRNDLRILVMSATLDSKTVAALLRDAPVVRSAGRTYPVELRYAARRPEPRALESAVVGTIRDALHETEGDVLVFLPGAREIRRVMDLLTPEGERAPSVGNATILPLHGSLPPAEQDRALQPDTVGRRKVVLATSVAETSLTIDGVRVVVDSGLSRVPRFSPRTGMTRLETVRAPRASTEQRAGRAGRTAPGICFRLWSAAEQSGLVPALAPEILEADLCPLALTLAAQGVRDAASLRWLDAPPSAAWAQARELLEQLGALAADGAITRHGQDMAALPVHPRLAHMLIRAREQNATGIAADLAALLEERDVLRGAGGPPDADVRLRLEVLREQSVPSSWRGYPVSRGGVHRVRAESAQLRRMVRGRSLDGDVDQAGLLLAFAYPDRIAQGRGATGRFLLRNGRGATLAPGQALAHEPWIVAAEVDDAGADSRILLAAPVEEGEIETHFGDQIELEDDVSWDASSGAVVARRRARLGALVLSDIAVRDPDADAIRRALVHALRREGPAALPWTDASRRLQQRMLFLRHLDPTWPDVSDAALLTQLDDWLGRRLIGIRRRSDLAQVDLADALVSRLDWRQREALERDAPTHITVPTGSKIPIDYTDPAAPVLAVRLQELFGSATTPTVAQGRVPLTLHLLSPAHRPVQVTRDLAGFWKTSYFDVRKDLRGRYPKHYWPENPLEAEPTRRAKKRK